MIIVGIILFALLILIHELGHFIAARRAGVEVEEFGIGFPPRLLSHKISGQRTVYSLNLLPLGGFVRLKGENNEDKRPRTFGAASFKNKTKILLAGVGMNILGAMVILTVLAWTGLPQIVEGQFSIAGDERVQKDRVAVASVIENSPAQKAGFKPGDEILTIDGTAIKTSQQLTDFTSPRPRQTVAVTWRSEGDIINRNITLAANEGGSGQLGVSPYEEKITRYGWAAPVVAVGLTLQLMWLTLVGLGQIIGGLISEGTSSPAVAGAVGPIGVLALLNNAGEFGVSYVAVLMVVISISLAVINALPIPALDGGRLALIGVFKALKKPLSTKLESTIHGMGFVLLILLALTISYFDVVRFF